MSRLTLIIDVPPTRTNTDPAAQIDPHDVGQDVVGTYNEWAEANGQPPVDFVAAEWGTRAP